jgi:hypothetical protein
MLDWNDAEMFKDIIGRRIAQSTKMSDLNFEDIWATFFPAHCQRRGFIPVHPLSHIDEAT